VRLEKEEGIGPWNSLVEICRMLREAELQLRLRSWPWRSNLSDRSRCCRFGKQRMSSVNFPFNPVRLRLRVIREEDKLSDLIEVDDKSIRSKTSTLNSIAFWSILFHVPSFHSNWNLSYSGRDRSSDSNLERCEIWGGISH